MLMAGCAMVQPTSEPLGSEHNPVKLALAPATETPKALLAADALTQLLTTETGLRFKLSVPTSHAAVIEAMATNNVDVGWLEPLGYVLAHERVGARPLLASVRNGSTSAGGLIVARADSGIVSLDDLRGTRFTYPDEMSAGGYVMPRALLAEHGIELDGFFATTTFEGSTSGVLQAILSRRADAGAIAGPSIPPALLEQLRVIARTDPVPNDTLGLRKDVSPALARQIEEGLARVAASPAGARLLHDLYGIDGLGAVSDDAFEPVRQAVRLLDLDLDAALAPRRPTAAP
jgi:phosphonate transport system substrate-binding protein